MHTALIGASRGIGRAAALDLLSDSSNRISLLLRTPNNIAKDPAFASAIKEGRVRIVKGDAYEKEDLGKLLDDGVDSVVFTLVYASGKRQFSFLKGFLLPAPDVCTSAILSLLQVLDERHREGKAAPALVAVSVTGVGSSAKYLPYAYKQTIDDKRGVETILSHVSELPSDVDDPTRHVLDHAALQQLTPGFMKEVLIVRPAQLKDTDGSQPLRASEDVSTYSTGRIELGK